MADKPSEAAFNAGWDAALAWMRRGCQPLPGSQWPSSTVAKHDAWSELSFSSSVADKVDG